MSEDSPQDKPPTITLGMVERAGEMLKNLKPLPRSQQTISKKDAVKLLSKQIQAMRKNGYTSDQIAKALTASGIPITTSTLTNYLAKSKRKPRPNPKQSITPPAPSTPPQPQQGRPGDHEQTPTRTGSHQGFDAHANTVKPTNSPTSPTAFDLKPDFEV